MSRFVSTGTTSDPKPSDEKWLEAQAEIEAKTLAKLAEGQQEGGKSLYEHLQARKAAKQEAFEEAAKLKNQFRALDDDEIAFLDSVTETSRVKEEAVKQETFEQLQAFRQQRKEAEKAALDSPGDDPIGQDPGESWTASSRKRRKKRDDGPVKGVKIRKGSSSMDTAESNNKSNVPPSQQTKVQEAQPSGLTSQKEDPKVQTGPPRDAEKAQTAPRKASASATTGGLGLAGYSSDED